MSSQRMGKYACLEIERKYLLRFLPADLNEHDPHWRITDHYIVQTRLRLRRMVHSVTHQVICKLGQKYPGDGQDMSQCIMTNLYLAEEEYQQLTSLPARQLIKRRYTYRHQARQYAIDIFAGHLDGLLLAEIECESLVEMSNLPAPAFAIQDVTADPFFVGGALAAIEQDVFASALAARLSM